MDLDAYRARIALPARPTLDAAGLERVQRAHRLAIPFENLDVALGRPVAIDEGAVFAKLVTARRGGVCFEHDRLFGAALAAFGFAVRPVTARVWLGAGEVPPLTHVLSLVTLDGQDWIADAGFGGGYAPPMPLVDGVEVAAPDGARFRLARDGQHGWMLFRDGTAATTDGRGAGPGWRPQFSFTTAPVWEADLAMGCHWATTAPASRFTQAAIVSIVLPHGLAALTGRHYRRHVVGGESSEGEIADPRVYRMRLSLMFGIDLSVAEVAALGLFA